MVRLSTGIEIEPKDVLEAVFIPTGSLSWFRLRGPQPLAVRDTLEIETISGTYFIRGTFARYDAETLCLAGVPVVGLAAGF